jgi:hypothetical protein
MASHLLTPKAVLSFPVLFSPKPRVQGEPVYSCALLFGPAAQKTPEYKALQQSVTDAAKGMFGDKVNMKSLTLPFHDAGEKEYSGYNAGDVYISPWSKQRPSVVDRRKQEVIDPSEVYAGQIVIANVTAFAWSNTGKKGVSFGLNHLLIWDATAPRIDGRVNADKAFASVEDLDDEEESASAF